jgi:hypothetical protein
MSVIVFASVWVIQSCCWSALRDSVTVEANDNENSAELFYLPLNIPFR